MYPLKYRVDYGQWAFDYDLTVDGMLSFTGATEAVADRAETVDATVVLVAPDVYTIAFRDGGGSIVSVQDFARLTVETWVTLSADGALVHMQGKIIPA